MKNLNKALFITLSWTWGLPLTLTGAIIFAFLYLLGYRAKRFGFCRYIAVGRNWGGLELGAFFLCDKSENPIILTHEHGHGVQNIIFGPLMPLIVTIPSAIRYWIRRFKCEVLALTPKHSYYSIWFERQANELGEGLIRLLSE